MIVYGVSCALAALIAHLGTKRFKGRNCRREILFFSCLPLFLVAAFRYDVGEDYLSYVSYFERLQVNMLSPSQYAEWIYHLLNLAVIKLGGGYIWVFIICSLLFYFLTVDQILQDSPDPGLSVFLLTGMGYVFIFFNAIRQMVGCAILLWSMRFVRERKFLPFLLCVAVASGFHATCVLFVLAYFWTRLRITPVAAFLLTGAVLLLSQAITNIALLIMRETSYAAYLTSEFLNQDKTAWITIAIHVVLLIVLSWRYREDKQYQGDDMKRFLFTHIRTPLPCGYFVDAIASFTVFSIQL